MANYTNLKNIIDQYITTNGQGDITGAILNDVLKSIVDSIGADFLFAGVAEPNSNPGSPDQNVFYLAGLAGVYTNFGGVSVPNGVSVLLWNGSWSCNTVITGDGVFDISAYKASGGNLATFADLSAALNSGNNIPSSLRRGGMSIKFVLTSNSEYVQYRYMAADVTTNATFTNTNNWQGVDSDMLALSRNLIESGAVANLRDILIGNNITSLSLTKVDGYILNDGTIASGTIGYHTNPISVTKNTAIVLCTAAYSNMAAISKYQNGSYIPLVLGGNVAHKLATYIYVADSDMQLVFSGYTDEFSKTTCTKYVYGYYTALKTITDKLDSFVTRCGEPSSPTGDFANIHTFPPNTFYQVINSAIAAQISNLPAGVTSFGVYTLAARSIGNVSIQILNDTQNNIYISANYGYNWSAWFKLNDVQFITSILSNLHNHDAIFSWIYGNNNVNVNLTKVDGYILNDGSIASGTIGYHTNPISVTKNTAIVLYTAAYSNMAAISKYQNGSYIPLVLGGGDPHQMKFFSFVADSDMQLVFSGYTAEFSKTTCTKYVYGNYTALKNITDKLDVLSNRIVELPNGSVLTTFDNLIAVGDSLTYSQVYTGENTSRQAYTTWPKSVQKLLGLSQQNIYAVSGATSKYIWQTYKDQFAIPQTGKTIVAIYLGTNNWFEDTIETSAPAADVANYRTAWADDYTGSMCKIIQTFINLGAKIILIRPWAGGVYPAGEVPTGWTLADTNEVLRKIAVRFNLPYIDAVNLNPTDIKYHYYPDLSGSNGLHLNDLGYSYFAGLFISEVNKLPTDLMKLLIPQ